MGLGLLNIMGSKNTLKRWSGPPPATRRLALVVYNNNNADLKWPRQSQQWRLRGELRLSAGRQNDAIQNNEWSSLPLCAGIKVIQRSQSGDVVDVVVVLKSEWSITQMFRTIRTTKLTVKDSFTVPLCVSSLSRDFLSLALFFSPSLFLWRSEF